MPQSRRVATWLFSVACTSLLGYWGWLLYTQVWQQGAAPPAIGGLTRYLLGIGLLLTGLGFGTGLWIFALFVMAHLIAGLPAFLGFIPLTWASLAGHLIFGVTVAYVVRAFGR